MDKKNMHQSNGRGGFKFDRENITSMLDYIKHRDKKRPFMTFMFFESPHAPYTFPEECIVKKDYLKTFNYSTVNIKKNIKGIKNRYLNSVNHLDTQLARVFEFLEKENLMDDTIIILSGDHGEEFLEKGHWGHNESFHEEQVRTPLIIYIPGKKHKEVYTLSSHLDIPATLAPFLGIINPPEDYSLGYDLFGEKQRSYAVMASWSDLGYVDNRVKYSFFAQRRNTLTTVNDKPLVTKEEKKLLDQKQVFDMMKNSSKFYVK
jgi:membrane-anchored protein YejM (alkaline phosphatase superfamily)